MILRIRASNGTWVEVPYFTFESDAAQELFDVLGDGLVLDNGKVKVDTTGQVENSPKPITAAAVQMEIGNIETLLGLL